MMLDYGSISSVRRNYKLTDSHVPPLILAHTIATILEDYAYDYNVPEWDEWDDYELEVQEAHFKERANELAKIDREYNRISVYEPDELCVLGYDLYAVIGGDRVRFTKDNVTEAIRSYMTRRGWDSICLDIEDEEFYEEILYYIQHGYNEEDAREAFPLVGINREIEELVTEYDFEDDEIENEDGSYTRLSVNRAVAVALEHLLEDETVKSRMPDRNEDSLAWAKYINNLRAMIREAYQRW